MSETIKKLVSQRIIPMLEKGIEHGWVELSKTDCENILLVLRTSISLEPLLNIIIALINENITNTDKPKKEDTDESSTGEEMGNESRSNDPGTYSG